MWETWIWSLDQEDPLEKEMAIHSSILAWRISWIEKSGELHSTGSQWVGHNWASKTTPTYLAVPGLSQEKQDLPSLFLACFWPGIKPWLPVLAVRSLSRWTTREVPCLHLWLLWILLLWMWCMDIQSIPCFQFLWVSVQKRNYWSHGNSMCNLWRKFLWNLTLYCKSPPRCWSMFLLLQNTRWRGETRWEWERGGWGWDGMGGKMDKQNVWSMLTVEYDTAMKRSETLTQATMWMLFEHTVLSERSRHNRTHCLSLIGQPQRNRRLGLQQQKWVSYSSGGQTSEMRVSGWSGSGEVLSLVGAGVFTASSHGGRAEGAPWESLL